ncbi:hypothetical protein HNQ91_001833 [Filimonas zeae]|uniref:Uncharacterized protein n=1 Tax=Filimonas zeae TaxID=1737353 RepID=A0A917MVG0_9BACT|nr:hypothetical protein [Filimonas zeae]MDR6338782.1 hypothetical protein [Filimonas zeae]GGH66644.1 hypothetical protein GCM10011379_21020 [Filimonas zeae]
MEKTITLHIGEEMTLLCDALRIDLHAVLQLYIDHVSIEKVEVEPLSQPVMIATVLTVMDELNKHKPIANNHE